MNISLGWKGLYWIFQNSVTCQEKTLRLQTQSLCGAPTQPCILSIFSKGVSFITNLVFRDAEEEIVCPDSRSPEKILRLNNQPK